MDATDERRREFDNLILRAMVRQGVVLESLVLFSQFVHERLSASEADEELKVVLAGFKETLDVAAEDIEKSSAEISRAVKFRKLMDGGSDGRG